MNGFILRCSFYVLKNQPWDITAVSWKTCQVLKIFVPQCGQFLVLYPRQDLALRGAAGGGL